LRRKQKDACETNYMTFGPLLKKRLNLSAWAGADLDLQYQWGKKISSNN